MTTHVDCPYINDPDVDHRYLAGVLPSEAAEAFERHYFACDLCWTRVKRGEEIRGALPRTIASDAEPVTIHERRRRSRWPLAIPVAAAAGILLAIGILSREKPPAESSATTLSSGETLRGQSSSLKISSHADGEVLVAAWSPTPRATSYLIRLLGADGALLFQRETTDTSVTVPSDLKSGPAEGPTYWEVQALDELRKTVATSELTLSRPPNQSR